ncbi:MAG: methyltransferase, partial [Methyloversatilis sp.]|nr:methyltransferase [Methyloversatilis sp.]
MDLPDTFRPSSMTGNEGLVERIRQAAERLLSSPRFHRWAAAFPLTRHT